MKTAAILLGLGAWSLALAQESSAPPPQEEVVIIDSESRLREKPLSEQPVIRRLVRQLTKARKEPLSVSASGPSLGAPLRGPLTVRSSFGGERVFVYPKTLASARSRHEGLDLAADLGTEVVSPAAGMVRMAREIPVGGLCVWVEHAVSVHSLLCHLSRTHVRPGQSVKAGERLGLSGMSGRASGPHLHWSVIRTNQGRAEWIDPARWLTDPSDTATLGGDVPAVALPVEGAPQSPPDTSR